MEGFAWIVKPDGFRIGLLENNGKLRSLVGCPLMRSFIIKMVFPTALAERELICPQLEHAILTDKQLGAINKHFGPPSTLILANLTYHGSQPYPSRLHMSNPVTMNWPAIQARIFLMTHFNHRLQTVFLILKSP
jgi:hypothetical protein